MRRADITDEDKAEAWVCVLARAFQVFAYYHWWKLSQTHATIPPESAVVLKNAALESSLMSLRDLDDFFHSNPKRDDLVASDYGFPAGCSFLSKDERDAINKKLTHLTYRSVQELDADPLRKNPRIWNNAELVSRAMTIFLQFMDYLALQPFMQDAGRTAALPSERNMIMADLSALLSVPRGDMDFPT